jgi:sugar lactone lactonase YvrE
MVSADEGLLVRREPDGAVFTHADLSGLTAHGWNEIVVDGRGNIYVNGGSFDFGTDAARASGIVALVRPDGSVRQVADGLAFPNGMAVTPDNATLIVAESHGNKLTAFAIAADGSLSQRRVWADLGDGAPDGICLDADGAVWYADVPNTRCVRVREGGTVLQTIDLDRGCFACMLGGEEGRTLYLVVREWRGFESAADVSLASHVLTTEVLVPGAGWP